jgi:hypothetical protein
MPPTGFAPGHSKHPLSALPFSLGLRSRATPRARTSCKHSTQARAGAPIDCGRHLRQHRHTPLARRRSDGPLPARAAHCCSAAAAFACRFEGSLAMTSCRLAAVRLRDLRHTLSADVAGRPAPGALSELQDTLSNHNSATSAILLAPPPAATCDGRLAAASSLAACAVVARATLQAWAGRRRLAQGVCCAPRATPSCQKKH